MSVPELQTGLSATAFTGQLEEITQMMREISRLSDPEEVFREYSLRIRNIFPSDRVLLIRRAPEDITLLQMVEITDWDNPVHPWDSSEKYLPLTTGLLVQLFDQADATLLHDFEVTEEDPAYSVLEGMRSLRAIPLFEQGETSQMVIGLKAEPNSYREEDLAAMVWLSNLFGRAIQNLMLAQKVRQTYQSVDRELKVIGEIQRSLLPEELPQIPSLELATYYQTSQRAGGDYYDFFPLPDGRLGILIADVSGHGTPAAVVMAIIHTIAHTYTGSHDPPSQFLNHLNTHLTRRYTAKNGTFVTAFYGIFDAETRNFKYASAGHNPPGCRWESVRTSPTTMPRNCCTRGIGLSSTPMASSKPTPRLENCMEFPGWENRSANAI